MNRITREMPNRKCCVPWCYRTRSNVILHKFPNPNTDLERFILWTDSIGLDVSLIDINRVFQRYKICNYHFESKYQSGSGRLTRNAVPTLFMFLSEKSQRSLDVSLEKVQSTSLHEPQECIGPGNDNHATLGKVQRNNTVHISQECIGPANDTFLERLKNKPTNTVKEGVTLKTYSRLVESKPVCIPRESIVPEKDTLPCPEQVFDEPVQEGIVTDSFSWEVQSEPHILQDEPADRLDRDDVPDNLSMYCDDDGTGTITARTDMNGRHEGFHCDSCKGDIVGYRYTCVQCSNLDLCVACETGGAHAHHYMLRVPGPRPYNEIQTILVSIRRHLMRALDPITASDLDNEDAISVKSDIKSEYVDEIEEIDAIEQAGRLNQDLCDEFKENSRLYSPGSKDSKNKNSEVSQNNRPAKEQTRIANVKQDVNRSSLVKTSVGSVSAPPLPSTAKRKIILSISEFLKLKESNQIGKKSCLVPNMRPNNYTTLALKRDLLNPMVKFSKIAPDQITEQDQIVKKSPGMLNTKAISVAPITLAPKAAGVFSPVVKLAKMPQHALLKHAQFGFVRVCSLNKLHNIMDTDGNS